MIETSVVSLRDPFVLVDNGVYYLYGTDIAADWECGSNYGCYKNTSGRLDGEWVKLPPVVSLPKEAVKNRWAPEVHRYKGAYYMFATYFSSTLMRRACAIFRADSPEGPFLQWSNGTITPSEWDAIDGTLYVDSEGFPWIVFVREWISTEDHIGRMVVARLSEDLKTIITEPKEIFRADAPPWANAGVTDGCFLYECGGQLQMIWSNFDQDGYCIGKARSLNGKVDGEWIQEERLYSKEIAGQDGGHGMIFRDIEGKIYLSLHSPNNSTEETKIKVIFVQLEEKQGQLRCMLA